MGYIDKTEKYDRPYVEEIVEHFMLRIKNMKHFKIAVRKMKFIIMQNIIHDVLLTKELQKELFNLNMNMVESYVSCIY